MVDSRRFILILATFLVSACAVQSARASNPPADLCSLLPATQVSTASGTTYDSPQKSVAPRFTANTATGTDCTYQPNDAAASKVLFRAYVDSSPDETKWLFLRLSKFYKTTTPVSGLGDEAYFDDAHALHVRKGKARFFFNLLPMGDFTPAREKELKDLAGSVVAQL